MQQAGHEAAQHQDLCASARAPTSDGSAVLWVGAGVFFAVRGLLVLLPTTRALLFGAGTAHLSAGTLVLIGVTEVMIGVLGLFGALMTYRGATGGRDLVMSAALLGLAAHGVYAVVSVLHLLATRPDAAGTAAVVAGSQALVLVLLARSLHLDRGRAPDADAATDRTEVTPYGG